MAAVRMVQREKKFLLNDEMLDVDVVTAFHTPGVRGRKKREKETTPAQKNLNEEKSKMYFVRLVLANFGEGDCKLDLTYNNIFAPKTPDELMRNGRNLLRRLKAAFKKAGRECKCVMVNAWGESKKTGNMVRPHHHLIISGGLSYREVLKVWQNRRGESYGYVEYAPLQPHPDTGIVGLATYLAEQPCAGVRRWSGTKNLEKPEYTANDSRYSKRKLARLVGAEPYAAFGADCAKLLNYENWNRMYPGYRLVGYRPRWNEDTGVWSVSLRFRRVA